MDDVTIRPFRFEDEETILRLNEASVHVLSPMDAERFHNLKKSAALVLVAEKAEEVIAFLMAFTDGADYDSSNYQWFSLRLKKFLYIDRVVINENVRSTGIGQRFYSEIEQWARSRNLYWLAAEVDIHPPNAVSLRFHEKQQFKELARQTAGNGNKLVSMQVKSI